MFVQGADWVVQRMAALSRSALQSVIKARDTANHYNYFPGGLTHTWVQYYKVHISSDQSALNEW